MAIILSSWLTLSGVIGSAIFVQAQDALKPADHFLVEEPAVMTPQETAAIYKSIARQMVDGYAQSDDPAAAEYQNWQQFNTTPYLSPGHGNRFLNNYGNAIATDYLSLKPEEKMPVGSILAKDSFTVTAAGDVFPGALFLMEKLATGSNPQTGDWRYVMIMPDGSLLGDTLGSEPEAMEFCSSCHEIAADTDYLYLIPDEFRRKPGQ